FGVTSVQPHGGRMSAKPSDAIARQPKMDARTRRATSRRDFIRAGAAGLAGTTIATVGCRPASDTPKPGPLGDLRSATPSDLQGLVGDGRRRRILLRGGVVLSLDPTVGDFEKADVLIDAKKIVEIGPTVSAGDAEIVDCSGTIVMPGFITTHHHMYETLQRSIIPDGLL